MSGDELARSRQGAEFSPAGDGGMPTRPQVNFYIDMPSHMIPAKAEIASATSAASPKRRFN